ncbi:MULTISPECIES: hypothetical protein [unclassified Luteimonas]
MRIYHDLLMLNGYISDPRLARELAGVPEAGDVQATPGAESPSAEALEAAATITGESPPAPPACRDGGSGAAHFGRGITTLCSTALSLFR